MKTQLRLLALILSWLCIWGPARAHAEIVYDNTTGVRTNFYMFSNEYGDDINLAGSSRQVTEFVFRYFGDVPVNNSGSFRIRFYANDGRLEDPTVLSSQRPSTLLWQSEPLALERGQVTVSLAVPAIVVPDRFTWTIQFANVLQQRGNGAGLMVASPPTIGALLPGRFTPVIGSYDDFWVLRTPGLDDSWSLQNLGFVPDGPRGNFYVQVSAVPEPTTVVLGVLGACGVLGLVSRSRRS